MRTRFLTMLIIAFVGFGIPVECDAKTLFHATRKAFAQKIRTRGFSLWKGNPKSRFGGRGIYLSDSAKTAMSEKKGADAMIRMRTGRTVDRRMLDITKPTADKVRPFAKGNDLRGSVKKSIVGPKLGQRIGRYANKEKQVVRYRSAKKSGGVNYFVPGTLVHEHPRTLRGIQMSTGGQYR